MIKRLSLRLARALGRQLPASEGEIEVYAYGLEIFLGTAVKLLLIVVISLFLGIFWPSLLVVLAFAGFRIPGGGVHLSTYSRCLFIGLTFILALAVLAASLPADTGVLKSMLLLVALLAVCTIIVWVPAGTDKKRVTDPGDIRRQKIKTGLFLLLWFAACSLFIHRGQSTCALALISGAAGGLFLVTPWGYRFFSSLDKMLNGKEVSA